MVIIKNQMKYQIIFFILIAFLGFELPAIAISSKEDILSGLSDIKSTLQQSKNRLLFSYSKKITSIIDDIDSALADSSNNCNDKVKDAVSQLKKLSVTIEKRKCKNSKNKRLQCIPIVTGNDLISRITNVADSLSSTQDLNNNKIVDLCVDLGSSSSSGSPSCLLNDEPEQTINTTISSNDDVIAGCNQGETLNLSNILSSTKLMFSTAGMVDTKLDLGNVEFYKYPLDKGNIFIIKNTSYVPIEVMISLDELTNISSDAPNTVSLFPRSQKYGFKVCIVEDSMPWNYKYSFKDEIGFSSNIHTGDGKYFLPFSANESYTVVQGEMGTFSHFGEFLYSIDFDNQEGTEIAAMRNGLVAFIKQDSNEGGNDLAFIDKANFIWILQNDGSIAKYVHLKQNGVLVSLGDSIRAGDIIGLSGNTGYTQGPHLHVQVLLPKGFNGEEKIPIRFKNIDGALIEGESYTATSICKQ